MKKAIVFFSHSSKDKEYISELKKLIIDQTSGTIEIFQSSDGESIPFGKNWVHRIEENLSNAKIMFVFISPNSIKSNWIYFESGFSYSKGIRVIPIGILGIDVGSILPPMSLLQGFNLHDNEGLNNIIAILNDEFKCKYRTNFSEIQFEFLQKKTSFLNYVENSLFNKIDHFETEFSSNLKDNKLTENVYEKFHKYLLDNKIQNSKVGTSKTFLYGMEANIVTNNHSKEQNLQFKIDLLKLEEGLDLISRILPSMYEKPLDKYWLSVYFTDDVKLITTNYKLSAHLNEFDIEMSNINGNLYIFKDLFFALDDIENDSFIKRGKQRLRIIFNPTKPDGQVILELIKFLFSIDVIYLIKNV
ncbi:MAG: toll/interleukin-1 receptor domain-containing protein [Candidatus Celaenobacter polaris]|nr:toll/interleukin-1 receptor domain-containing protein [Candidatus Celaenobacter polaris]